MKKLFGYRLLGQLLQGLADAYYRADEQEKRGEKVTACGMSDEDIAVMFNPFVRGSNEATGSGFGLGLAIAKRAVKRHGGTISARNADPCGLELTVRIPKPDKPLVSD